MYLLKRPHDCRVYPEWQDTAWYRDGLRVKTVKTLMPDMSVSPQPTGISFHPDQKSLVVVFKTGLPAVSCLPATPLLGEDNSSERKDAFKGSVYSAGSLRLLHQFDTHHTDMVFGVAHSPSVEDCLVLTVSRDREIHVFDATSYSLLQRFGSGHTDTVYGVSVHPNGRSFVTVAVDRTARVWSLQARGEATTTTTTVDVAGPEPTAVVPTGHSQAVYGVAHHPSGRVFATVSRDLTVRVFDAESNAFTYAFDSGHTEAMYGVRFHPYGMLATTGRDRTARFFLVGVDDEEAISRWVVGGGGVHGR
jgi:WD40 repeat protein